MSTPEVTLNELVPSLPAAQIDVTIRVTSQSQRHCVFG